jgi:hypothetical protein
MKGFRDVKHKCSHCDHTLGEFKLAQTVQKGVDQGVKEIHKEQQKQEHQKHDQH